MKLGRIYSYWPQIIGEEYADKVLPVELKTSIKKQKAGTSIKEIDVKLHVITNSSLALTLTYQKERILGRIESLFGERIITDIKIIHGHSYQKQTLGNNVTSKTILSNDEIDTLMQHVQDDGLRERLEKFAQSLYQSGKS